MDVIRKRRYALMAKAAQLAGNDAGVIGIGKEDTRQDEAGFLEGLLGLGNEVGEGVRENMRERSGLERCHGCGIGVALEWRNGPDGPRSLCDSCGVRFSLSKT